tara:strand:+ start:134 stop:697 length:564 start_codon:yes stop_codon:yes gene_type:complete
MKIFKNFFILVIFILSFSACSAEPEEILIDKITPTDTIYSFESLSSIGFKKSREYKVEGLTNAASAYYGFVKGIPEIDYEIRFYNSHNDAVEFGTSFAEERTGEDAVLKKDAATWKEGVKDARSCAGNPHGTVSKGGTANIAHDIQNCMHVKYADYVIYGNMVMLCAGWESEGSFRNCEVIINKLNE